MLERFKNRELNADEDLVARDNLKIKSVARYKAILAGDINMYLDIENHMIDIATCKGKAFEDSSIEEFEREIDSDMEHRGLKK